MMIKTINRYLAFNFLARFLQIVLGFSLLIFVINLIDLLQAAQEKSIPLHIIMLMSFLQIPGFINDIVLSLVLIAAVITFFSLSLRSEISIIRVSGLSLWQILMPIAFCAMLLGIFWITIFNQFSVSALKQIKYLQGKYIEEEEQEIIEPANGIWIKQENIENGGEEIIIQAQKALKEKLQFRQVTVWYFDKNHNFYKRINCSKMSLQEGLWLLENPVVNQGEAVLNKLMDDIKIPTSFDKKFVKEKILNNFQEAKIFSTFQLPSLIKDLSSSGFSTTKFIVYFNSLLIMPIIFPAMIFIACFFGLNHIRNNNAIVMIFLGVICGLILYIVSAIITALGSAGVIPPFVATWLIALICLAVGILLIYKKEII